MDRVGVLIVSVCLLASAKVALSNYRALLLRTSDGSTSSTVADSSPLTVQVGNVINVTCEAPGPDDMECGENYPHWCMTFPKEPNSKNCSTCDKLDNLRSCLSEEVGQTFEYFTNYSGIGDGKVAYNLYLNISSSLKFEGTVITCWMECGNLRLYAYPLILQQDEFCSPGQFNLPSRDQPYQCSIICDL